MTTKRQRIFGNLVNKLYGGMKTVLSTELP